MLLRLTALALSGAFLVACAEMGGEVDVQGAELPRVDRGGDAVLDNETLFDDNGIRVDLGEGLFEDDPTLRE